MNGVRSTRSDRPVGDHWGSAYQKLVLPVTLAGSAFSLVELLVVVAIIAILAGLLLPALAAGRRQALAANCVSNFKQLQMAWYLYGGDNNDWLVPNDPYWNRDASSQYLPTWGGGRVSYGEPQGTNNSMLVGGDLAQPRVGLLGRYVTTAKLFRCPADRSTTLLNDGRAYPRNRSCAMNGFIGTLAVVEGLDWGTPLFYPHVLKVHDLDSLQRSELLVWSDIHEDYISSCAMNIPDNQYVQDFEDAPGTRHNKAAAISFVDGHVELHRWVEALTQQPVTGKFKGGYVTGRNRDWLWLRSRMTRAPSDQW